MASVIVILLEVLGLIGVGIVIAGIVLVVWAVVNDRRSGQSHKED